MLPWLLLLPAALLIRSLVRVAAGVVAQAVESQRRWQPSGPALAVVARETVLDAAMSVLRPLSRARRAPRQVAGSAPPILLVPGITRGPVSLGLLAVWLRQQGRTVFVVGHGEAEASLPERAEALGERLAELLASTRAPEADIVAHGMGGVVAAFLLAHDPERAAHVHRLVTLATPWGGTRMAVFLRGAMASELLPGSHLLDHLLPPPVPTVCLWAPDDPMLVPAASAVPGGLPSVAIEGAGHLGLLASARAFRATLEALEQGPGDLPAPATPSPEEAAA